MTDNRTVKVTLVAVAQPYTKGMNDASTATSKLGTDIDKTGDKTKGFGTKVNAAKVALAGLAAAAGAVAATKLVQFLGDAVNAAGDLEQSVGGVDAVFGDTAETIHSFGRDSAEQVGLSTNAFNELVTVTGAMLKNKGLEDFTEKSLDLVQVGADLSATFGGSAAQAVEALNAAMRGESDPIERYGISLNEAAVNAELAAQGISGLEGAALEAAKAQARIDIIMRQSADATGAFAREANTLQGQQQRLNAEWENAQASLGQALLPAMTGAVQLMRDGVEVALAIAAAFGEVPDAVWTVAAALAAIQVLKLMPIAGTVRALGEALSYAVAASVRAGGGFAGAAAGIKTFTGVSGGAAAAASSLSKAGGALFGLMGGPWGIALTGGAILLGNWMQSQAEARREAEEFTATLDDQTAAITTATTELVALKLNEDQRELKEFFEGLGGEVGDLTEAMLGNADAHERVSDIMSTERARLVEYRDAVKDTDSASAQAAQARISEIDEWMGWLEREGAATNKSIEEKREQIRVTEEAAEAQRRANGQTAATESALAGVTIGTQGATAATEEYVDEVDLLAEEVEAAKEAQQELTDALMGMVDAAFAAHQGAIDYEAALDDLTAAIKENGETHDITTEKGRANQQALLDLAQQSRDTAAANLENGESLFKVTQDMEGMRSKFVEGAQQMGYTKSEANALADELGLTSEAVTTLAQDIEDVPSKTVDVIVRTADGEAAVSRVKSKIAGVTGKTVYVTVVESLQRAHMPASYRRSVGLAHGAFIEPRADGGFDEAGRSVPRVPMMGGPAYGKRYITWGEDETIWEGYVSGKPGMEARSRAITDKIAARLGGQVQWAADGLWSQPRAYAPLPAAPAPQATAPAIDYGQLAAAVAQMQVSAQVEYVDVARANIHGTRALGAPARWKSSPRIGAP